MFSFILFILVTFLIEPRLAHITTSGAGLYDDDDDDDGVDDDGGGDDDGDDDDDHFFWLRMVTSSNLASEWSWPTTGPSPGLPAELEHPSCC